MLLVCFFHLLEHLISLLDFLKVGLELLLFKLLSPPLFFTIISILATLLFDLFRHEHGPLLLELLPPFLELGVGSLLLLVKLVLYQLLSNRKVVFGICQVK
jgi:hypothetical protein